MAADFERVYTMTDYYDGPRGGIASVNGVPHDYRSLFCDTNNGHSDLFELRPVDEETLGLALEDWAIWLRWEDAFYARQTTIETHPALPTDRARHDEIAPVLAERLAALPNPPLRARVTFRPAPGHEDAGGGRWLEARWEVVEVVGERLADFFGSPALDDGSSATAPSVGEARGRPGFTSTVRPARVASRRGGELASTNRPRGETTR